MDQQRYNSEFEIRQPSGEEAFPDNDAVQEFSELALHLRMTYDQDLINREGAEPPLPESVIQEKQRCASLTVNVPGVGAVHKSTIFSILNSNPDSISKDRLKRVKSKISGKQKAGNVIQPESLALFDDVAVHVKENKKASVYQLGRVVRMRNNAKGCVEYKRPVSLRQPENYPKLKLLLSLYQQVKGGAFVYAAAESCSAEYMLTDVITKVQLFIQEDEKYLLDANGKKALGEFTDNVNSISRKKKHESKARQSTHLADNKGRVLLEIEG